MFSYRCFTRKLFLKFRRNGRSKDNFANALQNYDSFLPSGSHLFIFRRSSIRQLCGNIRKCRLFPTLKKLMNGLPQNHILFIACLSKSAGRMISQSLRGLIPNLQLTYGSVHHFYGPQKKRDQPLRLVQGACRMHRPRGWCGRRSIQAVLFPAGRIRYKNQLITSKTPFGR